MKASHIMVIAGAAMLASAAPASAMPPTATILDDRGTEVLNPTVGMRWGAFGHGHAGQAVSGSTRILVRLATSPWIGHRARIYMTLAHAHEINMLVNWTAGNLFAPGSLPPGGRALIYEGVVRDGVIGDTLAMTISADGRQLTSPTPLNFAFEIEIVQ